MTAAENWVQPDDAAIAVDGAIAMMSQQSFDALAESTGVLPKPLWSGKAWKCRMRSEWWMGRYQAGDGVRWYRIQIV